MNPFKNKTVTRTVLERTRCGEEKLYSREKNSQGGDSQGDECDAQAGGGVVKHREGKGQRKRVSSEGKL